VLGGRGEADDDAVGRCSLRSRERMPHERKALQRETGLACPLQHLALASVGQGQQHVQPGKRVDECVAATPVPRMHPADICLDMHTRGARKHGVSEQKLNVLAASEEAAGVFTGREQAALALTEAITNLGNGHVADDVYARAAAVFTDQELGQVIAMAVTINAWNRINVTVRTQPTRR
jgi:alkylhydroperoxidase family enzyme